jgi:dihydrofolate reductase
MKSYVFTQSITESPHEKVKIVSGEIGEFVRELKNEEGQNIYFCGGAELAAQLFAEDLIDEVILKVHPVFIGSGIPVIAGAVKKTQMNLISCKSFRTGVVILQYEVKK